MPPYDSCLPICIRGPIAIPSASALCIRPEAQSSSLCDTSGNLPRPPGNRSHIPDPVLSLCVGWFCIVAYDLDLVRRDGRAAVVHLERHVLDQEGPHLVAEAVRIKGALAARGSVSLLGVDASAQNPHRSRERARHLPPP